MISTVLADAVQRTWMQQVNFFHRVLQCACGMITCKSETPFIELKTFSPEPEAKSPTKAYGCKPAGGACIAAASKP